MCAEVQVATRMFKQLVERLEKKFHKPRALQEAVDVGAALFYTTLWHHIVEKGCEDKPTLKRATEDAEKLSQRQQRKQLQKNLSKQVIRMFTAIEEARKKVKDDGTSIALRDKPRNECRRLLATAEGRRQVEEDAVRAHLRQTLGFSVRVGPSTIAEAGDGVFLEGKARIGSVVALFPGTVYLAEHLNRPEDVEGLFPDPHFFMYARYDRAFIDGRTAAEQSPNEYALGHMLNHGPPNVMQIAYDFPADPLGYDGFPHDLRQHIPNAYLRPKSLFSSIDHSALVHSVAFVAMTDLEDQELFVNYRLKPEMGQLPAWYKPIDTVEDNRRWALQ